jgi:hypothetical protein
VVTQMYGAGYVPTLILGKVCHVYSTVYPVLTPTAGAGVAKTGVGRPVDTTTKMICRNALFFMGGSKGNPLLQIEHDYSSI